MTVREGDLLWRADRRFVEESNLRAFMCWLSREHGLHFESYEDLRRWSVEDLEAFWAHIWRYFRIMSDRPYTKVLTQHTMPGARWFEGSAVNYAEHILRHEHDDPDKPVLHHSSEVRPLTTTSWRALGDQVRRLATALRDMGIGPGDRVVSYMPNVPETVVAMLAVTAIGAVWSSAAPEFGPRTVVDRFAQIEPRLLFAADGYRFGGKDFDRRHEIQEIVANIPSLRTVIWLDYVNQNGPPAIARVDALSWQDVLNRTNITPDQFRFERVAHDQPLWVLYSSGTTGLPKAIVHTHVGILAEHYKMGALHLNLKSSSVLFFYSTTGWMMWNSLMLGPLLGGAAVLYDGSPSHPDLNRLWQLAAETRVTMFGASPTYVELMRKYQIEPAERFDLEAMEGILLAGSPATPETFAWFYEHVKPHLWVTSQSGGTEFCSGLVVGSPDLPVYAGEIQARALGADVHVLDEDGRPLLDQVGELTIAQPMPSMPIRLWGDKNDVRLRDTYFDTYPGRWRHGDFMKINGRGGCYIYGRSDSTLNRFGVRIGSSEIYRTMEGIEEIVDSLVVCVEDPNGQFYMPLFVQLRGGAALDDALAAKVKIMLRTERSPRHVPDDILAVPAIPYTLTGKKMEVPVRKLLMGWPPNRCFSRDAMKEATAIDWYISFAAKRLETLKDGTQFGAHIRRGGEADPR